MGKLSHTDKHNPYVQTGQPNPEETKPTLDPPGQHNPSPVKKEVKHEGQVEDEHNKTGTR